MDLGKPLREIDIPEPEAQPELPEEPTPRREPAQPMEEPA